MSVTSAPIGSTGQSLDGFGVNANVPDAFRESVVLTDPNDPLAVVSIVSTQPISFYGVPVWIQGTPSVSIAGVLPNVSSFPLGTTRVFGQVSSFPVGVASTFVVNPASTYPSVSITGTASTFVVNQLTTTAVTVLNPQSSTFVTNQLTTTSVNVLNAINISTMPALSGTTMVNVVSTVATPVNVTTQVTVNASSFPLGTTQVFGQVSTFPTGVTSSFVVNQLTTTSVNVLGTITIQGGVNVSSQAAISSSFPLSTTMVNVVSSIPFFVTGTTMVNIVSTVAQPIFGGINISSQTAVSSSWPLSTTQVNVVSSIPFFVAQSSAPWTFVESVSTSGGPNCTSIIALASLNTTVVKAGFGQLYGYSIANSASTMVYVKLCNASTAIAASTAPLKLIIGVAPSTSANVGLDMGVPFSTGILMFTTREPFNTGLTAPLGSTCAISLLYQ